MINNLSQNSIIEPGALATGQNLLGLLGAQKGFPSPQKGVLDFHTLVKSRLASYGTNQIAPGKPEKTATDSLPFMPDLFPVKFINLGHQPLGRAELASLQEIVTTIKGFASKVGRPIDFKVYSKTIGPISLQIVPGENQLNMTLATEVENGLNVKETLLAEFATIFDSINIAIPDHKPGLPPPSAKKVQPVPISQFDAVKIIENFMALGNGGPYPASPLTAHLDLDIEAVGNVAVDVSGEANKTVVQLRTSSTKTLNTLKNVLSKSDVLNSLETRASGRELKISKTNALNLRSIPDAHFIESHRGKTAIKMRVESPFAREVFENRLTAGQPKPSNVRISATNKAESLSPQRERGIVSVIGSKHDLSASKVLQTVQRVLDATTVSRAEGLESRVRFAIPAKSLGEITIDLENTKKQPRLQVTVSSDRARRWFAARFGQKVENVEIRVENHGTNKGINPQDKIKVREFKGLEGQFKLNSKLAPSQAIQTIQEVLGSMSQPEVKGGQSNLRLQLTVEKLGPLAVEISKDVDGAHLQLRTDSTQARDWLNQHLRWAGLKVEEIKTVDHKTGLMLRVEAQKPDVGLSAEPKTDKFGQGTDAGAAPKGLHGFLEVLFGPQKTRTKLSSKRHAINVNQIQRPSSRRKTGNLRKAAVSPLSKVAELSKDESDTIQIIEDFKDRKLSGTRIEGKAKPTDLPVEVEPIPHSEIQPTQPVLTLGNVHFDLVGNKMVGLNKVERSALPEMIQRILEFGKLQPNSAEQRLEVQLEVEKIGKLLVNAVKYKDKINLHVNVENADMRRLLETQLRPLIDQMFKEGIEIGKLEVSVRDQNPESGPDWHASDNDPGFTSKQNNKDAPGAFYPKEAGRSRFRQRDFGYNSMEILV